MADLKKVAFFHGKAANIVAQIEAGNIKAGNFVVGSDDNTLYYIDESLAAQPLGKQRLFVVDELPQEGQEQGVLYIDTTGRKGYVWDGTQFKAVFEQVDDLSGTLGTIQETLGTLTGTGDGSVQKTVQDAILAAGHLKRVAVDELPDAADAKTKADQAEQNAKTYADGLASNYATAAQGEKADSALQASDIKTGVAGVGTISVKGTDVAVHGLGDIASHAVSEFATAAQGEKADSAVQSVVEGTDNGTILVDSKSVSVHGLGSAAFTAASAYDKSGAATAAQTAAEKYADSAVASLKADIEAALTWVTL